MEKCDKCGEYFFNENHVCAPKYWVMELEKNDEITPEIVEDFKEYHENVFAGDHDDAALKFADRLECEDYDDVIENGMRLMIAPENNCDEIKIFQLKAEHSIDFFADEEE